MNGSKNGVASLLDRFKKPAKMVDEPFPKVCICVPSGDMVHKDFAMSLWAMGQVNGAYPLPDGTTMPAIPTGACDARGSLIVRNRNQCIEEAIAAGFDYALFIDSDLRFPPETLRRLLSYGKEIVGATYLQRDAPHKLLGVWDPEMKLTGDKLHKVIALPGGCILIKLSVFAKMVKPYYRTPAYEEVVDEKGETIPARIQGEDYYFCEEAQKLGFTVWLDVGLSIALGHVGTEIRKIHVQPQMVQPQSGDVVQLKEATDGQAIH